MAPPPRALGAGDLCEGPTSNRYCRPRSPGWRRCWTCTLPTSGPHRRMSMSRGAWCHPSARGSVGRPAQRREPRNRWLREFESWFSSLVRVRAGQLRSLPPSSAFFGEAQGRNRPDRLAEVLRRTRTGPRLVWPPAREGAAPQRRRHGTLARSPRSAGGLDSLGAPCGSLGCARKRLAPRPATP